MATKKAFINDPNLDKLLALLEAPVAVPAVPKGAPNAPNKPVAGLSLGDWKPPSKPSGKNAAGKKKDTGRVSSVFHRVIDVLSRGNYASAEAFKEGFDPNTKAFYEPGQALKGFWSGLAGKEKTRFSEVLKQHGHTGRGMGTAGVALDIFADPLTYLGVGLVGKGAAQGSRAGKAATKSEKLSRGLEAATPDVIRLGDSLAKFTARKVRARTGAKPIADDLPAVATAVDNATKVAAGLKRYSAQKRVTPRTGGASIASDLPTVARNLQAIQATVKTTVGGDSKQAASVTAGIVETLAKGSPEAKVIDAALNAKPKEPYSVEHLLPSTPEIAALQSKTDSVLSESAVVAPVSKASGKAAAPKVIDVEAEARKAADLKYDKEMGAEVGDKMADLRAAVADGDPQAAKSLRMIESDEQYAKAFEAAKKRIEKKAGGAVKPQVPAESVGPAPVTAVAKPTANPKIAELEKDIKFLENNIRNLKTSGSKNAPKLIKGTQDEIAELRSQLDLAKKADFATQQAVARGAIDPATGAPPTPTPLNDVAEIEARVARQKKNGDFVGAQNSERQLQEAKRLEVNAANQAAQTVPEVLAKNADIPERPVPSVERLIAAEQALDKRQLAAVSKTFDHYKALLDPNSELYKGMNKGNIGGSQGTHTTFTPVKQTNAWNMLFKQLLIADSWRKARGVSAIDGRTAVLNDPVFIQRMIDAVRFLEESMIVHGKYPQAGRLDPTPLRLSDFLARMEPHEIARGGKDRAWFTQILEKRTGDPRFDDMHAAVLAGSHAEDAAKIRPVIETVLDTVKQATETPLDEAAADLISGGAVPIAREAAKDAGASPVAQELLGKIAGEAQIAAKELPVANGAHRTGDIVRATQQIRTAVETKKLEDAAEPFHRLAMDRNRYLGLYVGNSPVIKFRLMARNARGERMGELGALKPFYEAMDNVEDWFALSFRTAFGKDENGDLVNMGADMKGLDRAGVNNANQRAHSTMGAYQQIFAGTTADDRIRMLRDAQLDESHPIAQRIAAIIDTAKRNLIDPQTVNDYLVRHYKKGDEDFARVKLEVAKVDSLGNPQAFPDEFDSWKAWDLKGDVAQHLFKLETAIDKAVVDKQIISHFSTFFGTSKNIDGKLVDGSSVDPLFSGRFFVKEDLDNFVKYKSIVKDFADESSAIFRHFDQVQGVWKTMATRINPQYYARNGVGEVFINWMHGVNSVKPYKWAAKTVKWRMPEVGIDAATTGADEAVTAGTVLFRHPKFKDAKGNPLELTTDMAWKGFSQFGARQTFAITDNLNDAGVAKAPNAAMRGLNAVADREESTLRMAHFLDHVFKSKAGSLTEAMQEAAATVNRAHGDYADLTKFERKVMKRIVPFYTWQRKVTPILLESALRNPGKVMVYPKIQIMLAQHYGLELDNANPFPQPDQVMPEWMQEGAQVPYTFAQKLGTDDNMVMGDPSNPFNDQVKQLNHPGDSLGSMLSPALKIPAELFMKADDQAPKGRQFFGGIPVKDRSEYLADQIPLLSTINRLTRRDLLQGGQPREKFNNETGQMESIYGEDEKGVNTIALLNWLTAAGLQENTKRRQTSGEFDLKKRAAEAERKKREEAARK